MKIMGTATFRFCFKGVESKDKSYEMLKQFLKGNDWLDEYGRKKSPLDSFHTEDSGECEVILAEGTTTDDFKDLTEELFESIKSKDYITWIKTNYNENTFNIVHKEAGKYLAHQTVDLSDLKNGDEVCVFLRKK